MTVAVLKNRLLDLTGRAFDETAYGQRSMSDLVRALPDLLEVDETTRPITVSLREEGGAAQPVIHGTDTTRVRPDLWRAIVDYSSGATYRWTGTTAVRGDELPDGPEFPVLPTLSLADLDDARARFLAENASLADADPRTRHRAEQWREQRLRTIALPFALRPRWNLALKQLVLARLTEWFAAASLEPPADLLQAKPISVAGMSGGNATEALRELIIRCVRAMTHDELRDLRLPPAAVLRAKL